LSISPEVVKRIADGPIDDGWLRSLAELDRKSKAIKAKTEEHQKMKAMEDLLPLVENLTNKVCATDLNWLY
jgi:vacuolar protein sorting-associated protein 52